MARGAGRRPDWPGRAHGPPPPSAERTWESVPQARQQVRRTAPLPRGSKARARRERARAVERANEAAAARRAALSRQHAARAVLRRQQAAAPTARQAPVAAQPRRAPVAPAGSYPVPRSWTGLAAVLVAGVAVVTAVAAGVFALVGPTDLPAAPTADDPAVGGAASPARLPGDYVLSRVDATGRVLTEYVIVREQPIRTLTVGLTPPGSTPVTPVLRRLAVQAAGRPVPYAAAQVPDTGTATISLGSDTRTARLRYVTSSVAQQTGPTSPDRALLLVNPLHVRAGDDPGADREVVRLAGDVLNLACVSGGALPQPCGRPDWAGWRVQLDGARSVEVLAQVDLPTG